jgi:hypothetical protein
MSKLRADLKDKYSKLDLEEALIELRFLELLLTLERRLGDLLGQRLH